MLTVQHKAVIAIRKTQRKVIHEAVKVILRIRKRAVLTVQHEATKVTRTTWRRVVAMIVLHGAVRVKTLRNVMHKTTKVT